MSNWNAGLPDHEIVDRLVSELKTSGAQVEFDPHKPANRWIPAEMFDLAIDSNVGEVNLMENGEESTIYFATRQGEHDDPDWSLSISNIAQKIKEREDGRVFIVAARTMPEIRRMGGYLEVLTYRAG